MPDLRQQDAEDGSIEVVDGGGEEQEAENPPAVALETRRDGFDRASSGARNSGQGTSPSSRCHGIAFRNHGLHYLGMAAPQIRRASPVDATGIVAVLEVIAAERIYSAIERVWSVEQEARYIESLSSREVLHVAVDVEQGIVGFQSLDLWSPMLTSMAHVGQLGTFLLPQWRGRGVGRELWSATELFARQAGYRKLAIQVRASNLAAQGFYRRLGFQECGRLTRQVIIDGLEDDEVLMEFFVTP